MILITEVGVLSLLLRSVVVDVTGIPPRAKERNKSFKTIQ